MDDHMPVITSLSINHHWAGVDEIERARFKDPADAVDRLLKLGASEAMVLQTCNRVEVYLLSESPATLRDFSAAEGMPLEYIKFYENDEALMHLLRLACGIESMVIGEDQILGQLKTAYLMSEKHGGMGDIRSRAVLKAIDTGKRARAGTLINKGSVSIGSAAVDLAGSLLGDLEDKTILVVGAGEMGTLVAHALAEKKLRGIYVANRTYEQALKLASSLGGNAVRLDDIGSLISGADVIICATAAPHVIITKAMIESSLPARNGLPLMIIDITNPRNVEESVAELPGVHLLNIDSLREVSDSNMERRRREMEQVEAIAQQEFEYLKRDYKRHSADSIIGDLYGSADALREAELQKAMKMLDGLTDRQKEIVGDLSRSLTKKLLAGPARKLRLAAESGDEERVRAARELFDIEEEKEDELSCNKAKAVKTE
jgi:glutamyl-tRNA reductase